MQSDLKSEQENLSEVSKENTVLKALQPSE